MKYLLTSAGITTRAIGEALLGMIDKPASEAKVAFIPVASNVETYSKGGVISAMLSLWKLGFSNIDIVDFTAAGVDWKQRLQDADVVYLPGGNTFHLLDQARKTGFDEWLKNDFGDERVYVGSSASTILMTPSIQVAGLEPGDENLPGLTNLTGLELVGFEVEPHCDAARFADVEEYAKTRHNAVYAIDDLTAIRIVDDRSEVISSGTWKLYN